MASTRLNKYIAESGMCSRREADRHIEEGRVTLNGRRASVGDRVSRGDRVAVSGQAIAPRDEAKLIVLALNKPVGIVSTTEQSERDNIVKFVSYPTRIFPIGRLDKDSQGLILLTNDGDLVNPILRAGNQHEKEYLVTVTAPITDAFVDGMAGGVPILGTMTKKCVVERVTPHIFRIVLVQGLNRQIRRMCDHFGYEIAKLERIRIMHLTLDNLPVGEWRELTDAELATLSDQIQHSSGEAPAGAKTQSSERSKGKAGAKSARKASQKTPRGSGGGSGARAGGKKSGGKSKSQRAGSPKRAGGKASQGRKPKRRR